MGQTTNKLLIILVVLCSSFFCHHVTGLDNISTVSTRHEDGRRVLAGLFGGAARTCLKGIPGLAKKLKDAFKKPDDHAIQQTAEFYLENGQTKNFTQVDAIDYLNCRCECPFQLDGACTCTAPQKKYCSAFQNNPNSPLKCLNCSSIPPPPPPITPRTVTSSASPLSDFVDTLLMMISTTITIIILVMNIS